MSKVHELSLMEVSSFQDKLGELVAFEVEKELHIGVSRAFVVTGKAGVVRGKHAHRQLTQLLVCVHGQCTVVCDDGEARREFFLGDSKQMLRIPPGIWAEQKYLQDGSVLLVLCDLPYDESDYIRDYNEFLAFSGRVNK